MTLSCAIEEMYFSHYAAMLRNKCDE